jgi:hypothetical protein
MPRLRLPQQFHTKCGARQAAQQQQRERARCLRQLLTRRLLPDVLRWRRSLLRRWQLCYLLGLFGRNARTVDDIRPAQWTFSGRFSLGRSVR